MREAGWSDGGVEQRLAGRQSAAVGAVGGGLSHNVGSLRTTERYGTAGARRATGRRAERCVRGGVRLVYAVFRPGFEQDGAAGGGGRRRAVP